MEQWDRERLFGLIPEARPFDWIEDLSPLGWLYHAGSLGQAIAYAELFWPSFVEHDGCILLADRYEPANFQGWMESTKGDRRAVEAVLNHTHILDLFLGSETEPTRDQIVHLGATLKEMWTAKLNGEFPGRPIVVSFPSDELEDLLDYQITVFQAP